jgi:hypothetical protein
MSPEQQASVVSDIEMDKMYKVSHSLISDAALMA